jgi:2-methylisocitrate lyase-like PEP mutase family enzyme
MSGVSQRAKAEAFRALHAGTTAFVMPNAWDAGSARLLETAGFSAIASTSAGCAFSLARQDYGVGREAILENAARLVAATELPVSADLENAFGTTEKEVAETMCLAGAVGLVGGSIEDSTQDRNEPLVPIERQADLVRAAAEAAHSLPFPFTLTARAEGFLRGRPDLGEVIARLQAYQSAGADVLFAPGLTREEDIRTVVSSVDRPLNMIMGAAGVSFTVAQLSAMGVKRISVGGSLARYAYGALLEAAQEIREHGTFGYASRAAPHRVFMERFAK